MYNRNLKRLLDGAFWDDYTEDQQNAIFDYLEEIHPDLNDFNADDFIVNGLMVIPTEEAQENDNHILHEEKDNSLILTN